MEMTRWRKSSHSGSQSECVEVGFGPGVVGVRDTKDRAGGRLVLSRSGWAAFLREVRRGGIPGSAR